MRTRLLAALLATGLLAACWFNQTKVVPLYISELTAPTELAAGATLHVTVVVQSGGCVRFDRVETEHTSSLVTIRAKGIDSSGPDRACTTDLRMNTVTVDVAPPFTDPLIVVAERPDGTVLSRTVKVQ